MKYGVFGHFHTSKAIPSPGILQFVQNKMYSQCCALAYKHRYCTKFRPLPWASDACYCVCVLMAHTFILNADGTHGSLGDAVLRAATNAATDVRP